MNVSFATLYTERDHENLTSCDIFSNVLYNLQADIVISDSEMYASAHSILPHQGASGAHRREFEEE